MRKRLIWSGVTALTLCVTITSLASAVTAPLTEEELVKRADIVATIRITAAACRGEARLDGQRAVHNYAYTFEIDDVSKGEFSEDDALNSTYQPWVGPRNEQPTCQPWGQRLGQDWTGTVYLSESAGGELRLIEARASEPAPAEDCPASAELESFLSEGEDEGCRASASGQNDYGCLLGCLGAVGAATRRRRR